MVPLGILVRMNDMKITGITKLSTIDFPDALCMTVYSQGCNRSCSYCQNQHLIPIESGVQEINWQDVLSEVIIRKEFIDAVVFSGGEPTINSDLLYKARQISKNGLMVGLHTNGDRLTGEIAEAFDYILLSHPNSKKILTASMAGMLEISRVRFSDGEFINETTRYK